MCMCYIFEILMLCRFDFKNLKMVLFDRKIESNQYLQALSYLFQREEVHERKALQQYLFQRHPFSSISVTSIGTGGGCSQISNFVGRPLGWPVDKCMNVTYKFCMGLSLTDSRQNQCWRFSQVTIVIRVCAAVALKKECLSRLSFD